MLPAKGDGMGIYMKDNYIIKNENEFVSDLLEDFQHILEYKENTSVEDIKRCPLQNTKTVGDIILSFSVSISAGLTIEILKYCISKLKTRKDYNKNDVININDVKYTLEDIERK